MTAAATSAPTANEPHHLDPSEYGIDSATGIFRHPAAAPYFPESRPVKGSLDYLEDKEYLHNMTIEGRWPHVVQPGVTFQNFVDMGGRRYLFHYYRTRVNVYDVTEPKKLTVVLEKRYARGEGGFGGASIAYNKALGKWIMIQSFAGSRAGPDGLNGLKYADPKRVATVLTTPGFRGIRTFELKSPTEWVQLGEISTDALHPHAAMQQGSGSLGTVYHGGRYATVAAAADDTFVRMEYPNYIYSAAQHVYDVSDPAAPRLVGSWWVPGQRLGEEEAYRGWRHYANRTAWTGARMPLVLEKPIEDGGRYGYTAMGGLGFHVLDLADPANIKTVASLDLPLNIGGIEGDFVDASRVESRGIVLVNGYAMNEDGYEPYKDIYVIDVRNRAKPRVIATLPRPTPPKDAPYSDFVLRRGKFGPKRAGNYSDPGTPDPNVAIYPFNNAGIQVFDIADLGRPRVAASFVPTMTDALNDPTSYRTPMECIAVEWDRKLIWGFANSGLYLLSTPALGEPNLAAPQTR